MQYAICVVHSHTRPKEKKVFESFCLAFLPLQVLYRLHICIYVDLWKIYFLIKMSIETTVSVV